MSLQIHVVSDQIVGPHLGLLVLDATRSPVVNLRDSLAAVMLAPVFRRNRFPASLRDGRLTSGMCDSSPCYEFYERYLSYAADEVARAGRKIVIEPKKNATYLVFLKRQADAHSVIEAVAKHNLLVQMD